MTHPHETLARSEMEATLSGDLEAMLSLYTDDVAFFYPGRNPLSGTYRGKDAIRAWAAKIGQLLGEGGSITRELEDVLASDDHAVQLVGVTARRADGRSAHWWAAIVMHFREDKISDILIHIDNPYAVDELFAS